MSFIAFLFVFLIPIVSEQFSSSSGIIVKILKSKSRAVDGSIPETVSGLNIAIISSKAEDHSSSIVWRIKAPSCSKINYCQNNHTNMSILHLQLLLVDVKLP